MLRGARYMTQLLKLRKRGIFTRKRKSVSKSLLETSLEVEPANCSHLADCDCFNVWVIVENFDEIFKGSLVLLPRSRDIRCRKADLPQGPDIQIDGRLDGCRLQSYFLRTTAEHCLEKKPPKCGRPQ